MFIGREEEMESFHGLWAKRQASLAAHYGSHVDSWDVFHAVAPLCGSV